LNKPVGSEPPPFHFGFQAFGFQAASCLNPLPNPKGSLKTHEVSFGEAKTSAARFISTPPRFQAALSSQKTFTP